MSSNILHRDLKIVGKHHLPAETKVIAARILTCLFNINLQVIPGTEEMIKVRFVHNYMLFAGWEVRIVNNCGRGLENAAQGRRPYCDHGQR